MATAVPTAAAAAPASAPTRPAEAAAPLAPATIEETGLTSAFVADLMLKLLYQRATTAAEIRTPVRSTVPSSMSNCLAVERSVITGYR